MALIKCIECGNDVSSLAPACPKCGAPVPKELIDKLETASSANTSQLKSIQATPLKITLNLPNKKPLFEEPITMGKGLAGGFGFGCLIVFLEFFFGDVIFIVEHPYIALIGPLGLGMVFGAWVASLQMGKPPKEKKQSIDIPYVCPYCTKPVSYLYWGLLTLIDSDLQSLRCSACGNVSSIEWALPISLQKNSIEKSSHINVVIIKGPDDAKKFYLVAKELSKDSGIDFNKAKEELTKGFSRRFEKGDEALKFIEKYKQMGCWIRSEGH